MVKLRTILLVLACAAAATTAHAQFRDVSRPNTRGFFFKFGATSSSLSADSITNGRENGVGTVIGIGVGLTPRFALAFDGGGLYYRSGDADHFRFDNFSIGARWHFPREDHRIVPYGDVMLGGYFLRRDSASYAHAQTGTSLAGQHDIDCSCWALGGGALYFLTSTFAIDANAHMDLGSFKASTPGTGTHKPDLSLNAQVLRLAIGVAFYPDKNFRPRPFGS